jgi:hypothetical protein
VTKPLYDEILILSYTRNIFPHHPAKRGTARNGQALDVYSIHIEPYERILNKNYPGLRGKLELKIEDLKGHEALVADLESRLHDFAWRMGGRSACRAFPLHKSEIVAVIL